MSVFGAQDWRLGKTIWDQNSVIIFHCYAYDGISLIIIMWFSKFCCELRHYYMVQHRQQQPDADQNPSFHQTYVNVWWSERHQAISQNYMRNDIYVYILAAEYQWLLAFLWRPNEIRRDNCLFISVVRQEDNIVCALWKAVCCAHRKHQRQLKMH